VSNTQIARVLDEDELEQIAWRAGRGCHFEGGFLYASEWGKQVIQEDVPLLIAEIRKLKAAQQSVERIGLYCTACGSELGENDACPRMCSQDTPRKV
jgi:hypothetical protein